MEEKELPSISLRVHINFAERVKRFQADFLEKNGIEITTTQATKIINDKITKKGGLVGLKV